MLSRKHYRAIAECIKDNTSQTEDNNTLIYDNIDRDNFINDLCDMFKRDNNLFNSTIFRRACDGLGEGINK